MGRNERVRVEGKSRGEGVWSKKRWGYGNEYDHGEDLVGGSGS